MISPDEAAFNEQEAEQFSKGDGQDNAKTGVAEGILRLPVVPGLGIKYEDVQSMLIRQHRTTVSPDDPILMMVTVCNALLEEMEKLLQRHPETVFKIAVSKLLANQKSDVMGQLPDLPEGQEFGMDFEHIQGLLIAKNKTTVHVDDPLMMMVSVCNANLAEMTRLYQTHNVAVKNLMADQSKQYIEAVKATTGTLGEVVTQKGVDGIKEIFNSHIQALNTHANTHAQALKTNVTNALWCAGIMVVTAAVNVVLMAIRMWG
jgi:hypothetical protein